MSANRVSADAYYISINPNFVSDNGIKDELHNQKICTMTIQFKLNGRPYNNPDNEEHKKIQNDLRNKIESAIEQNNEDLKIESTANLEIDYNEGTVDKPRISLNGFGPETNPKMLALLHDLFDVS